MRQTVVKRYPGLPKEVNYVIQPYDGDMLDARMMALCRRWMYGQASEEGLVSKGIVETEEFYAVLRNVMLLEIERSRPFQYDYIFRIHGADIVTLHGQDMTGKLISAFEGPECALFLDLFDIALTRKSLVYAEHAPPLNIDVEQWQSLVLPLGEDKVEWILVVSLPSGPRLSPQEEQTIYLD
ncbi:MAG: hypothetical protein O2985_09230 [Proteobacteria bacterium]|nr:hypothetical protein [Pseudomonadota bacterium]